MSIATKRGDSGQTGLLFGERVSKSDLQVEAYGTLDELNAFLGLARSVCDDVATAQFIEGLQRDTFVLGAELATPARDVEKLKTRVDANMTARLDDLVQQIETMPGLLDDWALPGATHFGAAIDVARAVARRAERCVVRLNELEKVPNPEILRYMNRLSDALWLLGRRHELQRGQNGALRI